MVYIEFSDCHPQRPPNLWLRFHFWALTLSEANSLSATLLCHCPIGKGDVIAFYTLIAVSWRGEGGRVLGVGGGRGGARERGGGGEERTTGGTH